MEQETFTLDQLKEANLIVRNEYEGIIKELQSQMLDMSERLRNLEKTVLYKGKEDIMPQDAPKGFEKLSEKQKSYLIGLMSKIDSDWHKNFIRSVLAQGSTSEKQREIIKEVALKVH